MRAPHPRLRSTGALALAVAVSLGCADLIGIDDWHAGGPDATAATSSGGAICGNGVVDGDDECDDGNQDDNDGCTTSCGVQCDPPGAEWVVFPAGDRHCYGILKLGSTWSEADAACKSFFHGDLAAVTGNAEQAFLAKELQTLASEQRSWIGAIDLSARGQWRWTTGEPFVTKQWGVGQPNDTNKNEDCAVMDNFDAWKWNDINCADPVQYALCERHPGLP